MKNLKKVLALALALVMLLGIMVTASATLDAYSDAEKITYDEAVDTLTGLGIMNGMTATTFVPQGDLTREQAAKLITYLAVGSTAAEALKAVAAPFDDVAANRWSSGYIAYCKQEGIINGIGDGNFDPTAKVTGLQFAKMLLCTVGYGVNGEYTGEKWAINTAKDALKAGIFAGNLAGASSVPATREEAALYTFNTLFVDNVAYSALLDEYTTGSIIGGASGAYGDIATNVFNLKTADSTTTADGTTGYYYTANGKQISNVYSSDKVLGTSTDGTAIADLTTATSSKFIAENDSADYYVNGTKITATTTPAANNYWLDSDVLKFYDGSSSTAVIGKGVTVELVDVLEGTTSRAFDGKVEKILVTVKTVSVITAAPVVTTTGSVSSVTMTGTNGLSVSGLTKTVVYPAGLALNDVVLYYIDALGVTHVEKATAVTGQMTSKTSAAINFAGKQYTESGINGAAGAVADFAIAGNYNVDATIYLDNAGYMVLGVATPVVSTDYVAIMEIAYINATGLGTASVQANVLKVDGTTEVITIATIDGLPLALAANSGEVGPNSTTNIRVSATVADNASYFYGKWYTYTKNTAGAYVLVDGTSTFTNATGKTVTKGAAAFDATNVANNSTVFIVKNATTPVTYTVYTGIANVPSTTTGSAKVTGADNAKGIAQYVYIDGTPATAVTKNYIYVTSTDYSYYPAVGTVPAYREYAAIVDGAVTTVKTADSNVITAVGAADVTYTDGFVTAVAVATPKYITAGTGTTPAADGVITLGGTAYSVTDATKVYFINGVTRAVTTGTIANITTDANDTVVAGYVMADPATITPVLESIFITVVA